MEGKNPSFYKILMELSSHLRLPQGFMQKYGKMLPKQVELRVCNNTWNTWKVGMKKQTLDGEDHYFFEKGWTKFCEDARLEIFELLVFSYVDKSTFLVTVYGVTALEKTIFKICCGLSLVQQEGDMVRVGGRLHFTSVVDYVAGADSFWGGLVRVPQSKPALIRHCS
ncbi:hypothetical protein SASPL_140034 [Salvia splendens]|uniref:TF-B3 domain-containing protein n=1 Tax=Salvia splendens TaxID=180675 RepID=A0A8X8WQU5_SALSN|nr:hypothetical protein SASPL_140034 [Salvia splendens]